MATKNLTVEEIVMACRADIQMHIHYIMEAKDKMNDAEKPGLSKFQQLTLLSEATDLIHKTIDQLGYLENLLLLRDAVHDQFIKACTEEPKRILAFGERPESLE
jgi:hypothetical protein